MKKIKYIGYYDCIANASENRNCSIAGASKMDYIIQSLVSLEYEVEIVSICTTRNKRFHKGKKNSLTPNVYLRLFPTFPWGNKLMRIISVISVQFFFFFYILFNVKKNENILVYHSLGYVKTISILKKIKKFNLILEVEEIYSDVIKNKKNQKKEENLFKLADSFLFPSKSIEEKVNINKKRYAIVHGSYKIEKILSQKYNDGKIHLVYAGNLDKEKGGAQNAVCAMKYLGQNYHLHILGFGSKDDIANIKQLISSVQEKTESNISYDGVLRGDDYLKYVQRCHIGLNTQNLDTDFNDSFFPSKVLSFLSNGLQVVSGKTNVLVTSNIKNVLHFYESGDLVGHSIALTIKAIDVSKRFDCMEIINQLDAQFTNELKTLLTFSPEQERN